MTTSPDQRMVEEFLAGRPVPEIAERYAVPEAYIDRLVEDTDLSKPAKRTSSGLQITGNRILTTVLVMWAAWLLTRTPGLLMPPVTGAVFSVLIGVVAYMLLTTQFGQKR